MKHLLSNGSVAAYTLGHGPTSAVGVAQELNMVAVHISISILFQVHPVAWVRAQDSWPPKGR